MKVLVFIESAALSRYWLAAVPLLNSRGINASLVTLRESGPLTRALREQRVQVFSLGAKRSIDYPRSAMRLAAIVRKHSFDIVHASEPIPAAISCAATWVGAPHKRLFHRHHFVCPKSTRAFDAVGKRFSDAVMACSNSVKLAATDEGISKDSICVAYNGITPLRQVDEAEIARIRSELQIPPNAFVISQVARLSEEKGQLTLLDSTELVARAVERPIHVVFTGSGPLDGAIRQPAESKEDISVHLTGHQEDVAPWFALADVNVVPSYTEAFGIAAVEAMASGKPLVASGVEGLKEVVEDGVSGLLVPPRDAKALAAAIVKIIKSPELASKLGQAGVARVNAKFTTEQMVDGWIDCYNWALRPGR